jgi:hypothetical protein
MDNVSVIINKNLDLTDLPITSFHVDAFSNVHILSAILPQNTKSISAAIFDGCFDLLSVMIPCSFEEIPDRAFRFNYNLSVLKVNGINVLENGYLNLSQFKRAGNDAFVSVHNIQKISINCSVFSIGDLAFSSLSKLEVVEFLNIVNADFEIDEGSQPFYLDFNLTNIRIDASFCLAIELPFEDLFSGSSLENKSWIDFGCSEFYDNFI